MAADGAASAEASERAEAGGSAHRLAWGSLWNRFVATFCPRWRFPISNAPEFPRTPDEITSDWLTGVLRSQGVLGADRVVSVAWEGIGEGFGLWSEVVRLRLTYDTTVAGAPATLIAKFPSSDEEIRAREVSSGIAAREVRFYQTLASEVPVLTPRCYFAETNRPAQNVTRLPRSTPAWLVRLLLRMAQRSAVTSNAGFVLLLEDLGSEDLGDQVRGCEPEEIAAAVTSLSALHSRYWESDETHSVRWLPELVTAPRWFHSEYLRALPFFIETRGEELSPGMHDQLDWLARNGARVIAEVGGFPTTLIHGDFRLDNLCFGPNGVVVFDWQNVQVGPGVADITALTGPMTKEQTTGVLGLYHGLLVEQGVRGFSLEECQRARSLMRLFDLQRVVLGITALGSPSGRFSELVEQGLANKVPVEDPDALLSTRGRG